MKVCFLIFETEFVEEIEYVARLFSSVIAVDICVQNYKHQVSDGAVTVGYAGVEYKNLLPKGCKVNIVPDSEFWKNYINKYDLGVVLHKVDGVAYFNTSNKVMTGLSYYVSETCNMSNFDMLASSFFLVTKMEEAFNAPCVDHHGRFMYKNSIVSDELDMSLIHLYAKALVRLIEENYGICIPFRSKTMEAVISHDIDIPYYFGKIRSVLSGARAKLTSEGMGGCVEHLLSYVKVRAGVQADRFATFDYIMQTQAERGIKSTWFILLCTDNLWGLDLEKYGEQLKRISEAGHEIALHPGYDSYLNIEKRANEKKAIEQLAGCTITGARNHFLRFKIPESYHVCQETGLKYDSTLGFAEREGFRSGFCSPFKPFDPQQRKTLDILEIPMSIMDGTFRDYQGLAPQEAEIRIRAMIDHVADVNGSIVFNWHNTFLLAEEPEWRKVYENSLDYLIEKNAFVSTADELARKWSDRWR